MSRQRRTVADAVDPIVIGRAREMLSRADLLLDNALGLDDDAERFRQLYLAALRAAGSALAIGEHAHRRSTRGLSSNAWRRLAVIVPELGEYADFFAARSSVRMEIEAGIARTVAPSFVAETHRRVLTFLDAVESMIIDCEHGGQPIGRSWESSSLAHPA